MGLPLSDDSKPPKLIAIPAVSSMRAGITSLFRRANLAPAVLIIAGVSFLAHILVGDELRLFPR